MTTANDDLSITIYDTADPQLRRQIHEAIKAFNDEISPAHKEIRAAGGQALNIAVHDGAGSLVGGLTADTYWGWLDIDDLWLREAHRHQGIGTQLLAAAENEARQRGCRRAMLKTFSFQAREFYEKNGYQVTGRLNDYPPGECFYWMCKELDSWPPAP